MANNANNDASITKHVLTDQDSIVKFFKPDDIFIVDRGFRDVIEFLKELGINAEMPAFLDKNTKQLSDKAANYSRIITKTRWVVESVNGLIKTWKYFANIIPNSNIRYLQDDFRIFCALINRYRPDRVVDKHDDDRQVAKMLSLVEKTNQLKKFADEHKRLSKKNTRQDISSIDFPILTEDFIRSLTFGVYQLKQAKSYTREHLDENGDYTFEVFQLQAKIIREKIESRHRSQTVYNTFIKYSNNKRNPIESWYCDCKAGARVVGTCAHVASVLWYLGIARHDQSLLEPTLSSTFLSFCENAADCGQEPYLIDD